MAKSRGRVSVRDTDKGAKKLEQTLLLLKNRAVTIGVHGDDAGGSEGSVTVGDVANFHEFGMGHNPVRSFIGAWFDEQKEDMQRALLKILEPIAVGKGNLDQALNRFGLYAVARVRQRMNSGIFVQKADGDPSYLNRTGQLQSSIKHKVESV